MSAPGTSRLHGVVPIVPTPFTADERIDFDALGRCVRFAANAGLGCVCLPAYASEFYKLSDQEREQVVLAAVDAADGRLKIMAQANHPSARVAAEAARRYEVGGAGLISLALPRLFSLAESDLLDYCRRVCRAVSLEVLIQDFNPGGPTVGADFARRLADDCPNFRYLKLEEPLMGAKVRAIVEATERRIGVLEGWGGMYLLELIESGICGLMPGLGVADLLHRVWQLWQREQRDEARAVFGRILPQIVFALAHCEFFLWMEKRLLAARGILPATSIYVRSATRTPDAQALVYGEQLNDQLVALAQELGLAPGV